MAIFTPKKQEATSFNNGEQYRNGDAVQPEALNNLIEGVLYAQESGLTEEQEAKVEKIVINGNGDKFLANNGEYKEVNGGTTVTVNGEAVKTFDADTKLDKVTTRGSYNRLYAVSWDGKTQLLYNLYEGVSQSTIVQRDNSQIKVPETPVADNDATSKKYVDEKTGLYQHQVTFKFYRISDNLVIDSGTLVILSKSATLIDNVEELRKYVGRAVFADCTAGNGVTIIDDNSGTLRVTIGEASAIIYDSLTTTEATTLEDSVIEL